MKLSKKAFLLCALAALLLLLLCACGSKEPQPSNEPADSQTQEPADTASPDTAADDVSDPAPADIPAEDTAPEYDWLTEFDSYATASEAAENSSNLDPFFILHDGRFYHLTDKCNLIYYAYSNSSETPAVDDLDLTTDKLPVLDLSAGDKLVVFESDETSYDLIPVSEIGGCLPVKWMEGKAEKLPKTELHGSNPEFSLEDGIDEINGTDITTADPEAFSDMLDSLGFEYISIDYNWQDSEYTKYVALMDPDSTVTLGQYKDTSYIESTFSPTVLYELSVDQPQNFPVEKTHDGYFVVDVQSLGSGSYAVRDKSPLTATVYCFSFTVR